MGVSDGSPVSAAVTNPAFLDANADDTALGKINFNNIADPTVSGPVINNIQREANSIASFAGKTTNIAYDATPAWTNNQLGAPTDSLFVRTDTITERFDGTTGHAHTGVNGDGALISGAGIGGVPYMGFFNQGTQLVGVTGFTHDVSTELFGKAPSTASTALGVVVNTPYNKVVLRDTNGDEFVTADGDMVYARVTELATVWTLTFYYLLGTTETAYSFPAPVTVDWYYQEIYNPLVSTPVYSQNAVIPSDNATADVVYATTLVAGKILLSTAAPPAVGVGVVGTSTRAAREDHTHTGGSTGPAWTKYTKTHLDFQTAALTNNIELFSLPAYGVIQGVIISHSTAFVGTGITAYTISIGIASILAKYASAFDVFQATGNSVKQASDALDLENKAMATSIRIAATSVGANLDQSTAGSVDV